MKKYLLIILFSLGIPVIILFGIFVWTDPFRILKPFNLKDVDVTNREYLSTELFLYNKNSIHYNSFIFGSSRCCGLNSYRWKQYLDEEAQPFLFQGWSETLTGIEQKFHYLIDDNIPIENALILLDIPSSFAEKQLPKESLSMKHYLFTGVPRFEYNAIQFYNFCQKPSLWIKSIKKTLSNQHIPCNSDTITNDWDAQNRYNYFGIPQKDSLKQCSDMTRITFFAELKTKSLIDVQISEPLINHDFRIQLENIKSMLDKQNTDYHIIITPAIVYTNPIVNKEDLQVLQQIFGADRVHDYSQISELTTNIHNYTDPNHFGQYVGYYILKDIYE